MPALDGVKVLDLTRVHAGPFASMILGDLGATVLKVEPPGGDDSRRMTLYHYDGMSAFFVPSNRNKRSIELDLRSSDDRQRFDDLLRTADVLIDNFRPGTLARLELDYATVSNLNPSIISVSVTGWGEGSPAADAPAYDLLAQAQSGVMSLTGRRDDPPLKCGVPIGDLVAGIYAATGTIAALYERQRTGVGQRVEVAMLDAQIALLSYHFSYFDASGQVLPRVGSEHQNMVPYGIFTCRDGYIAIAVVPEPPKFWHALCEAMGKPEWIDDPRFATNSARIEHRESLKEELEAVLRQANKREWYERLRMAGVPTAVVNELSDLLSDEQVIARSMLPVIEHASYGPLRLAGNPIKMEGALPESSWLPPPLLGEGGDPESIASIWTGEVSGEKPGVLNPQFLELDGDGVPHLRGWRCGSCGKLAFGERQRCPICGNASGAPTELETHGRLETWSKVASRDGDYVIGYALLGDGHDGQIVRVFGPIDAEEMALARDTAVRVEFRTRRVGGRERIHHVFVPDNTLARVESARGSNE